MKNSQAVLQKAKNLKDKLADYSRILYAQACLINGMPLDNPSELSEMVCSLMV